MRGEAKQTLMLLREKLRNSEFDRTYSLWTVEEDEELLRLHNDHKLTRLEIAQKLRRTLGSINARLKLHTPSSDSGRKLATQLGACISLGANPITGEVLKEGSIWTHPEILADLKNHMEPRANESVREGSPQGDSACHATALSEAECRVFRALIGNIESFCPRMSDRDVRLIKFHYGSLPDRKTLAQTGAQFNISRERVRQIRDKSLRKLNAALRHPQRIANALADFSVEQRQTEGVRTKNNQLPSLTAEPKIAGVAGSKPQFFQIERCGSFTPFAEKNQIAREDFSDDLIQTLRDENARTGRLLNHGFPITWEEVHEIKHLYFLGSGLEELERHFQRSRKSIDYVLEKVGAYE